MYYTDPTEGALASKAVETPANSGGGIAVYSNGDHAQSADEYAAEHIMPAVQNALTKILDAMPETDHATEFVRYLREGGERQRDFIYSRVEPKTIQAMVSLDVFSASISELYRSQMAVCRAHLNSHPSHDGPTRKNSDESNGSPTDSTAPAAAIPADEEGYFNKVPITVQLLPRGKVPEKDLVAAGNTESRQTSGPNSRVLSPLDGEGLSPTAAASDAAGGLSGLTLDDERERAVLTKTGKTVKYQLPSPLTLAASMSTSLMPSAGPLLQGFNYGVPIPTADSPKTPNRFSLGGLANASSSSQSNNNATPTAIKGSGVVSPSHASAGLFDMEKSASLYPLPTSCIQTGTMPLFGLHCPNKTDLEATFLHLRHAKGVTKNISLIFLLQNETVFIDKVPYAGNKWRSLCHAYGVNVPFRPLEEAIQSAILDERLSTEGRRVAHHDCDTLDDVLESLELKANVTSTRMERLFCPDLSEHPHPLLQFSLVELLNEIVFSRVLPHAPDSAIVVADFAPSRLGLGLVQSCLATAMHCYADRFVPYKVLRRKKSNGDQMLEGDSEDDADEERGNGSSSSGEGQHFEGRGEALATDRIIQMIPLAKGQHVKNEDLAQPIRTTTFQRINRRHEAMLDRRATRDEHRRQAIARYRRELLNPENATPDRIAKIHEKIATMQKIMLSKASRRQTRDEEYERFQQKGYSTAAVVIQASLRASLVRRTRLAQAAVSMSKAFGVPLSSLGAGKESSTSKEIATELKRMYDALALATLTSGPSSLSSTTNSSEVPTLTPSSGGAQSSTSGVIDNTSKLNEGKGALFGPMRLVVSELIAAYSTSALAWDPPFCPLVRTRSVDEWGWAMTRIRKECEDDVDSEDEVLFHSRRECVSRAAEREGRVTYDSRFARSGAIAFVNICDKKPRRVDPYRETLRLMRLSGCDAVDHLVNVAESFAGCSGMQKRAYRLLASVTHLVMNMSYCALRAHRDASVVNTCKDRPLGLPVSLSDWLRTHHGALLEKLAAGHLAALCVSTHNKKGFPPQISSAGPCPITVAGSDWTVVSAKALPEGAPVPWRALPLLQHKQHAKKELGASGENRGDDVAGKKLITASPGREVEVVGGASDWLTADHRTATNKHNSTPRHITFLTAGNLTARSEASTAPTIIPSPAGDATARGGQNDEDDDDSTSAYENVPFAEFVTDEARSNETIASGYSFFHYSIPVFAFVEPLTTKAMRDVAKHLIFYTACSWISTSKNLVVYVNDDPFAFVNRSPNPDTMLPSLAKIRVRSPPKPAVSVPNGVTSPTHPTRQNAALPSSMPTSGPSPTVMSPKPPGERFGRVGSIRVAPMGAGSPRYDGAARLSMSGTLHRKSSEVRSSSSLRRRRKNTGGAEEAQIVDDVAQLALLGEAQCDTNIPCDEVKWLEAVSWQEAERRAAAALKEDGDPSTGKLTVYEPVACGDVLTRRGACTLEGCEVQPVTIKVFDPIAMAAAKAAAAKAKAEEEAKRAAAAAAAAMIITKPNDPNLPDEPIPLYLQPVRRRSKPEVVFVGEQRIVAEYDPADESVLGSTSDGSPSKNKKAPTVAVAAAPAADTTSTAEAAASAVHGYGHFAAPAPSLNPHPPAHHLVKPGSTVSPLNASLSPLTPIAPMTAKSAFAAARMNSIIGRPPPLGQGLDRSGVAEPPPPPDVDVRSYSDACREHILRRHPMEGSFTRVPCVLGTNSMISAISAVVAKTQSALPASCLGIGLDTVESVPVLAAALITWCVREDGLSKRIMDEIGEKLKITERIAEGGSGGGTSCDGSNVSDELYSRSHRERSVMSVNSGTNPCVNVRLLRKDGSLANVSTGDLSGLRLGGRAESDQRYIFMTNAPPALLPIPLIDMIEARYGTAIGECMANLHDSRAFVDCLLLRSGLSPILKIPLFEMGPFVEQLRRGEVSLTEARERFLLQKRVLEFTRATERYVLLLLLHIYLTSTHGSVEKQKEQKEQASRSSRGSVGGRSLTPRRKTSDQPPPPPDTTVYTVITFKEFMQNVPFAKEIIRDIDAFSGLRTVTKAHLRETYVCDADEAAFLGSTAGPEGLVDDMAAIASDGGLRFGPCSEAFSGELSSFLPDPHYLMYCGDSFSRWAAAENYVHRIV